MSVLDEISKAVDERGEEFTALSDQIWDNPELRWNEFASVAAQIEAAEQAGFTVQRQVAGIPTAFSAEYGTGGRVIAILGVRSVILNASIPSEIDAAFTTLMREGAGGLVISGESFFYAQREKLIALAARLGVPTIYPSPSFFEAGGLMAIPRGQAEAASALGLSYWKTTALIVMPQALRHVIPGLVNSFISLFKDTSLVSIVALFDLLGSLRASFSDPVWATPSTAFTGFAFTGMIYFAFCFGMSRYSQFVERRLNAHRRN